MVNLGNEKYPEFVTKFYHGTITSISLFDPVSFAEIDSNKPIDRPIAFDKIIGRVKNDL